MGTSEEAWDLQARQRSHSEASTSSARSPDNNNSEAERVYSAAVQKLPTTRMFDLYLEFLEEQVGCKSGTYEHLREILAVKISS